MNTTHAAEKVRSRWMGVGMFNLERAGRNVGLPSVQMKTPRNG